MAAAGVSSGVLLATLTLEFFHRLHRDGDEGVRKPTAEAEQSSTGIAEKNLLLILAPMGRATGVRDWRNGK